MAAAVAGAVHAGGTLQRIHTEARVIGDGGQAAGFADGLGLDEGILGKGGAGLVGVELLDLGKGLLEGVSSENLQIDSLLLRGRLGGAGIGTSGLGRLVARAAGKAKAGGSRKRDKTAA